MFIEQRMSNAVSSVKKFLATSWDTLLFFASMVVVSYATGVATGHFRLPPYHLLFELAAAGKDSVENWRSKLSIEPTQHLSEGRHQGAGVILHVADKSSPGVTLIESVFNDRVGLRLFDNKGKTLHTWPALYSKINPNHELIREEDVPANDWETMVHGSALYPDGDVLFNLPKLTMVRMNACGDVEWTLPHSTHHSIHIAENGSIWTLGRRFYEEPVSKFPGLGSDFRDELVLEVSPQGEILREISLLEVLYANDLIGSVFPIGLTAIVGNPMTPMADLLHANDVETLSRDAAPAFPQFEPGDALVSFRNLNLLIVFDPDSRIVKWSQTGPWLRQHDPDFLPDGRFLVFDNRDDGADGRILGGSRLLAIDPVSRRVETIYEGTPEEPFYTAGRGTANLLANGNFLISEADSGRVFEVNPDGTIVWSFINRYDADRVLAVNGASRYPESFGRFDRSRC